MSALHAKHATPAGTPEPPQNEFAEVDQNPLHKKVPKLLKVYGILLILASVLTLPVLALLIIGMVFGLQELTSEYGMTTYVILGVDIVILTVSNVLEIIFGINLLRNKRRFARQISEILIVATIGTVLCDLMITGLTANLISYFIRLIVLIACMVYLDPSLSEERALQRKLRDMETRERAEDGTLGRDETGKGYIQLDFFNLFWIFVVCCVLGLIIETVYHFVVVDPGHYQDRTGMLYGPFSPIYGFGAVLMTVALNRFHNAHIVVVFLVSAVIGGAFEYLVSWFLQFAFGIVAWDYTGTFLSIDGRTNAMFMTMWGVLGCVWVKLLLPKMLQLVNIIPWNWRYGMTTVCAALMIVNGFMTLAAFDCWYQREAGEQPANALEEFCADHYDDEFMEHRFQSMSIDPSNATRTNQPA